MRSDASCSSSGGEEGGGGGGGGCDGGIGGPLEALGYVIQ